MNKNILLPVIVGITLLGCFLAVNANFGAMKQNLNLERYNRLDAERKLDAAMKSSRQLEQQLSESKRKLEGIQNIVSEGQSVATELKSTVESTERENSDLKLAIKKLQDDLQKATAQAQQAAAAVAATTATPPATAGQAPVTPQSVN